MMIWMMTMFEKLYNALFQESNKEAAARFIARHLAHVSLYELKGVDALHPDIKPVALAFLDKAKLIGFPLTITETFRTAAIQQKYYDQGRKSPGSIITNAEPLKSYHQYGLAFDVAFQGETPYPTSMDTWRKVGELGESMGLIWGGRFNDNPHFESHKGYTYQDLIDYFKL